MPALLHEDLLRKRAAGRRMIRGFAASWLPIWTWSLQGGSLHCALASQGTLQTELQWVLKEASSLGSCCQHMTSLLKADTESYRPAAAGGNVAHSAWGMQGQPGA